MVSCFDFLGIQSLHRDKPQFQLLYTWKRITFYKLSAFIQDHFISLCLELTGEKPQSERLSFKERNTSEDSDHLCNMCSTFILSFHFVLFRPTGEQPQPWNKQHKRNHLKQSEPFIRQSFSDIHSAYFILGTQSPLKSSLSLGI